LVGTVVDDGKAVGIGIGVVIGNHSLSLPIMRSGRTDDEDHQATRLVQSDDKSDKQFQEVEHPGARVTHRHICATTDDIFGRDNRAESRTSPGAIVRPRPAHRSQQAPAAGGARCEGLPIGTRARCPASHCVDTL
jgi:hypothetical protein